MTDEQFDEIRHLLLCIAWATMLVVLEVAFWLWLEVDWKELLK